MLDVVLRSQMDNDEVWSLPLPKGYTKALDAYSVEMERYIFHEVDKDSFLKNAEKAMNEALRSAE